MAEHSYEIVIKVGKGTGSASAAKSDDAKSTAVADSASGFADVGKAIAFKSVKNIADQSLSFVASNVGLTTGNTEAQQRIQFAMQTTGELATFGAAIATGNYLAAALSVVNKITSIYFNAKQISLEQSIETESLKLSRERAGVAFNRSRLGGAS